MDVIWCLYGCYMVFVWTIWYVYYFILLHVFIMVVKNTYFEGFLWIKVSE